VLRRWLGRLGIVGAVTIAVLAVAPDAHAADTHAADTHAADGSIDLVGPLPTTADSGPPCKSGADRPYPSQDLWRFGLPGGDGSVKAVQLWFVALGGHVVSRTVESRNIDGSMAWLVTDPGWALVSGTATATGGADTFALIESCAAAGKADALLIYAQARPDIATPERAPRALASGTDIGATVTLGSTIVLAGVLLLVVRRRPRGRHRRRWATR
jgi:hypothetical protein